MFVLFFLKDDLSFINSAGHVPAREITISGGKKTKRLNKKEKKNIVTMWERTANKYC